MIAELIIGAIQISQAKKNLKTAKINRQIQYVAEAKKLWENTGGEQRIENFITEYDKTKQLIKEDSIWV